MHRSLQSEILDRLAEAPDARCLAFYRDPGPAGWWSRQDLHRRAAGAASRLVDAGVRPGEVCVIVLPSGEPAVAALVAALLVGAVPLLVAPPSVVGGNLQLAETLRSTLRQTRARVAVCAASMEPDIPRLRARAPHTRFLVSGDDWSDGSGAFDAARPRDADVAAMQLTSGTTASPRICVWDHRGVLAALDGMASAMDLRSDDLCLNWTPLYHDMGLVNNFLLCLVRGVPLVLLSPQEFIRRPAVWLRSLSDTRATLTWSPNFGFAVTARRAQDHELAGVRLDGVRAFWNAAERIHLGTLELFRERFAPFGLRPDALKTNYGCAENVGGATFSAPGEPVRHELVDRRRLDERGVACRVADGRAAVRTVSIVSAGRPHPLLRVHIVSPRGRRLEDGRVGEICLDTPSRLLRYHRNVRQTRRALRGGLLHTGDLGYLRDGELFWTGRLRERITIHGKKFDPSAFESLLADIEGLREGCFVAFGVPDAQLGTERLVVVSEVRSLCPDGLDDLAAAIRRECYLHAGIAPADVVLVRSGTLAKTSSGKRRHRHFRGLYLAGRLEEARLVNAPVAAASAMAAGQPVGTP